MGKVFKLSGNAQTYIHRHELRKMGFEWDPENKRWYLEVLWSRANEVFWTLRKMGLR